jgi:hypothetical protein
MKAEDKKKPEGVMAPVDYLIVRFPERKLSGKIGPEIERLQKEGIIRVIDLIFITRDKNGDLALAEAKDMEAPLRDSLGKFVSKKREHFTMDDLEFMVESLPRGSSVGALIYENTWALRFKKELIDSDAELFAHGRIPGELLKKFMEKEGA